jgi:negative regulator of flagellin synthesis FlgM
MVDSVTLWPVRPVPKSLKDDGARATRSEAMSARTINTSASLPKLVNLAAELANVGPPVDYAKIAQVRQAIAQGDYLIDVDTIAHSMVGFFRSGE